jgi:hypothetical protein
MSSHPQCVYEQKGNIIRLQKFEVELPAVQTQGTPKLQERDVTIATMFGVCSRTCPHTHANVHAHTHTLTPITAMGDSTCSSSRTTPKGLLGPRQRCLCASSQSTFVCLLACLFVCLPRCPNPPHPPFPHRDGVVKTDVLQVDMNGRFAINVVDNLIVVHHQASRASIVYDIKCAASMTREPGAGGARSVYFHMPIVFPQSIAPTHLLPYKDPYTPASAAGPAGEMQPPAAGPVPCELCESLLAHTRTHTYMRAHAPTQKSHSFL